MRKGKIVGIVLLVLVIAAVAGGAIYGAYTVFGRETPLMDTLLTGRDKDRPLEADWALSELTLTVPLEEGGSDKVTVTDEALLAEIRDRLEGSRVKFHWFYRYKKFGTDSIEIKLDLADGRPCEHFTLDSGGHVYVVGRDNIMSSGGRTELYELLRGIYDDAKAAQ